MVDAGGVSLPPAGMDLPGFRLHPLKGELAGYRSGSVSGYPVVFFDPSIALSSFAYCDDTKKDISYLHLTSTQHCEFVMPEQIITTVSTKGQIILPKAIRRALRWEAGTRLIVENRPEGVLLKPEPAFAETRPEDVFGRLICNGPPKSLAEMQAGVLAEARRRHAGD